MTRPGIFCCTYYKEMTTQNIRQQAEKSTHTHTERERERKKERERERERERDRLRWLVVIMQLEETNTCDCLLPSPGCQPDCDLSDLPAIRPLTCQATKGFAVFPRRGSRILLVERLNPDLSIAWEWGPNFSFIFGSSAHFSPHFWQLFAKKCSIETFMAVEKASDPMCRTLTTTTYLWVGCRNHSHVVPVLCRVNRSSFCSPSPSGCSLALGTAGGANAAAQRWSCDWDTWVPLVTESSLCFCDSTWK